MKQINIMFLFTLLSFSSNCLAYEQLIQKLPNVNKNLVLYTVKLSQEKGLPPEDMVRLMYSESKYKQSAVSRVGALGVAQVMPLHCSTKKCLTALKNDPLFNIKMGVQVFSDIYARQNGDFYKSVAQYKGYGSKPKPGELKFVKELLQAVI